MMQHKSEDYRIESIDPERKGWRQLVPPFWRYIVSILSTALIMGIMWHPFFQFWTAMAELLTKHALSYVMLAAYTVWIGNSFGPMFASVWSFCYGRVKEETALEEGQQSLASVRPKPDWHLRLTGMFFLFAAASYLVSPALISLVSSEQLVLIIGTLILWPLVTIAAPIAVLSAVDKCRDTRPEQSGPVLEEVKDEPKPEVQLTHEDSKSAEKPLLSSNKVKEGYGATDASSYSPSFHTPAPSSVGEADKTVGQTDTQSVIMGHDNVSDAASPTLPHTRQTSPGRSACAVL